LQHKSDHFFVGQLPVTRKKVAPVIPKGYLCGLDAVWSIAVQTVYQVSSVSD